MSETTKTVIQAAAVLIVFGLSLFGVKMDADVVVTGLSGAVAFVTLCIAIWKNFNFTRAAQQGQMVTNRIKNELRAIELKERKEDE